MCYRFKSLKSITIPSSVTIIGESAFYECASLESITIPSSVTIIGEFAFKDCTSLKSITIPSSVTTIGEFAFKDCTSLESITIPSSVTTIGKHSFGHCSFKSIVIPSSVTFIGNGAFIKCEKLESVEINAQITCINAETFYDCSSLSQISIPDSVDSINEKAFYNCNSLIKIDLPRNLKSIDLSAFNDSGIIILYIPISASICPSKSNTSKNKRIEFYDPKQSQKKQQSQSCMKDEYCTFSQTGKKMIYQKLFICKTCNMENGESICETCAKKCHAGHNVSSLGFIEGYCDCGAGNISCKCCCNKIPEGYVPAFIPGPCAINKTGEKYVDQNFFNCTTCMHSVNEGCCETCAKTCHLGHILKYSGFIPSFCDCGCSNKNCKCVKIPNPAYQEPQ